MTAKKKLTLYLTAIFLLLFCVCAFILLHGTSFNLKDSTVIEKGTEYSVKLKGIYTSDDDGFILAGDGFYPAEEKICVFVDENGFAKTTDEKNTGVYLSCGNEALKIYYDKAEFCSDRYKNEEEFKEFLAEADRINGFDINKIPDYLSDIINYDKKFPGKATVRLYKGKCIVTELFIGEEKIIEVKY